MLITRTRISSLLREGQAGTCKFCTKVKAKPGGQRISLVGFSFRLQLCSWQNTCMFCQLPEAYNPRKCQ